MAIALCLTAGGSSARPAAATDLESLRQRAQRIADDVTALEHRLESLRRRRERIDAEVVAFTQQLALLEAEMDHTAEKVDAARTRYVRRAVEAYKEGATSRLALVLSAEDFSDVLHATEAASRAADADVGALRTLRRSLREQERAQARVDERKQQLLAAHAAAEEISANIHEALAERRSTLRELHEEIEQLERQARLEAARAARADAAFAELLAGSGPAAEIPEGYVGTGITFEGIASWYGPGFAGETTANGQTFDPQLYTAASRDLPFGTMLFVRYEGRGVIVVINDRGPYIEERILDLSRAAAEAIGLGLGWVTAEIVVPAPAARG